MATVKVFFKQKDFRFMVVKQDGDEFAGRFFDVDVEKSDNELFDTMQKVKDYVKETLVCYEIVNESDAQELVDDMETKFLLFSIYVLGSEDYDKDFHVVIK